MTRASSSIYLVVGETSGDELGADLVSAIRASVNDGLDISFAGLAGPKLQGVGVKSLFDIEDIAVMGITAVVARLPTIIERVRRTVADILSKKPDVLVLIDSPDFTHAVAKRVRRKMPDLPIINYVCPSVWAWRPARAPKMKRYVDHVLAILPFEPEALAKLGGPDATFVGHPMVARLEAAVREETVSEGDSVPILLVLPGSRNTELTHLLKDFGKTIEILKKRGLAFRPVLPAVSHLRERLERETAHWPVRPEICDASQNDTLFPEGRAALVASGTVSLELAMHRVPHASAYRFGRVESAFLGLVTVWSALLPNLIADRMIVPEEINGMVKPERMARHIEAIWHDGSARSAQLDGFEQVRSKMTTQQAPGAMAAEIVLEFAKNGRPRQA